MTTETFEQHCLVELFGHSQLAGKVTEQAIGGATFIRVDVPQTAKREAFTRFYGPGAIYALTPVSAAVALAMAEALNKAPIQEWRLSTLDVPLLAGPDDDDWPDGDERPDPGSLDEPDGDGERESQRANDKREAAKWARDLLAGEFVIFDTETTGFETHDEIIQIGIVDHTGATVLDQLIKPKQPILNADVHHITDERVREAPAFPDVYASIKAALEDKTVVAYNLAYDRRMLGQVCARHDLTPIAAQAYHCVMEQYAQFHGEWDDYHGNYRWQKLREALAQLGLQFEGDAHHAVVDCKATLALLQKMAGCEAEPGVDPEDLPF